MLESEVRLRKSFIFSLQNGRVADVLNPDYSKFEDPLSLVTKYRKQLIEKGRLAETSSLETALIELMIDNDVPRKSAVNIALFWGQTYPHGAQGDSE